MFVMLRWNIALIHTPGSRRQEMKRQAKMLGIATLLSPQSQNSEASKAMQPLGFNKVIETDGWEYLMMAI